MFGDLNGLAIAVLRLLRSIPGQAVTQLQFDLKQELVELGIRSVTGDQFLRDSLSFTQRCQAVA